MPGIESVAATSTLPMTGITARTEIHISGRPPAKPSDIPSAYHQWISTDYFRRCNTGPARAAFVEQDNERGAGVMVVDKALARRFFGNDDPIGAHILVMMGDNLPAREYEMIGVVGNVKRVDLSEEPVPTFYGPMPRLRKAPCLCLPIIYHNGAHSNRHDNAVVVRGPFGDCDRSIPPLRSPV